MVSGNCFIFNERQSGIKRWRDRASWSPSRMLSNFLLYRERDSDGVSSSLIDEKSFHSSAADKRSLVDMDDGLGKGSRMRKPYSRPQERALVGCLVDESFKDDGLVKKTISVHYQGEMYHLVSYYKPSDVKSGRLLRPTRDNSINHLQICDELLTQNFRVPLESESRHAAQAAAQADAQAAMMSGVDTEAVNIAANATAAVAAVAAANSSGHSPPIPSNMLPQSVSPVNNMGGPSSVSGGMGMGMGMGPSSNNSAQSLAAAATSPTSPKAKQPLTEKYLAYRPPFGENPYAPSVHSRPPGSRYMYANQD